MRDSTAVRAIAVLLFPLLVASSFASELPKRLAYSAFPTPYFNDHAADVAKIYDGLFFILGSWDEAVASNLGIGDATPVTTDWKNQAETNLLNLRKAGVTENLLGVSFSDSAPWPSPSTLLSDAYREKFSRHFRSLGKCAKELGFRGVSIDVEYPYPRYEFGHSIYTYDKYTAEDLLNAAATQGRSVMTALLDEFPEAVIFLLPGELGGRPIEEAFVTAMLEVMAERDAPGGLHLGFERAYCLLDPTAQVAIPRVGDLAAETVLSGKTLDYWRCRCTVSPGVWPVHMVETGGRDYPVRAWKEELAELGEQMKTLRAVAKRYIWSFSGQPMWYQWSPEVESKYGLKQQTYKGAEEAIPGWQEILADRSTTNDSRTQRLVKAVQAYDRGEIGAAALCDHFGTPGEWMGLGFLGNPFTKPAFSAPGAVSGPIRIGQPVDGRDGQVRWFRFKNFDPTGHSKLKPAFGYRNTSDCSAHMVTEIEADRETACYLHIGWDDGVLVRLGDQVIFDRQEYPENGHGLLYLDRYDFEEHTPVTIPAGRTRLAVTSINSHGSWGVNLRFGDEEGFPLEGVRFTVDGFDCSE